MKNGPEPLRYPVDPVAPGRALRRYRYECSAMKYSSDKSDHDVYEFEWDGVRDAASPASAERSAAFISAS